MASSTTTTTNASSGNTNRPVLGARTSSRIAANQVLDYCAEKLHLDASGADKSRGRKDSTLEGGDATTQGDGGVADVQKQKQQEKRRSGGSGFDKPKVMFGMSNDV